MSLLFQFSWIAASYRSRSISLCVYVFHPQQIIPTATDAKELLGSKGFFLCPTTPMFLIGYGSVKARVPSMNLIWNWKVRKQKTKAGWKVTNTHTKKGPLWSNSLSWVPNDDWKSHDQKEKWSDNWGWHTVLYVTAHNCDCPSVFNRFISQSA